MTRLNLITPSVLSSGWGIPASLDPGLPRQNERSGFAVANDCMYYRVRDGGPITKVTISVGVQSGNICVAAYRNSGIGRNAVPGTRLATSGSVACPAGDADVALGSTVVLLPGDWLALACDNLVATFRQMLAAGAASTQGQGRAYKQATAFPCPTTPASLSAWQGLLFDLVGG